MKIICILKSIDFMMMVYTFWFQFWFRGVTETLWKSLHATTPKHHAESPSGVHALSHFDDFPSIVRLGGYPQEPENPPRDPKIDILEPWGQALAQKLDF